MISRTKSEHLETRLEEHANTIINQVNNNKMYKFFHIGIWCNKSPVVIFSDRLFYRWDEHTNGIPDLEIVDRCGTVADTIDLPYLKMLFRGAVMNQCF